MSLAPQMNGDDPGDLAAEYALGVLDAGAQRAAEARAQVDPAFAAEAAAWSEHLSPLLDEIAPETPSPALWPRILRRLNAPERQAGVRPVPTRDAAPDAATLRRRIGAWRATALTAMAASVALAAALGVDLSRPTAPPPPAPVMLVAELKLGTEAVPLLAAYDPGRRAVLISLTGAATPAGRSPQLWVIDAAGAPHALGLLKVRGVAMVVLPAGPAALLQPAATLAISIEPMGGSPTGLPTGPVIAKGALTPA